MTDQEMRMHYIGACCLLGRMLSRNSTEQQRGAVRHAMNDCLRITGASMEIVQGSSGSLLMEPLPQEPVQG